MKERKDRHVYMNNLCEIRKKQGISLRCLQGLTGIGRGTLHNIEKGRRPMSEEYAEKLSIVLGCRKEELYEY